MTEQPAYEPPSITDIGSLHEQTLAFGKISGASDILFTAGGAPVTVPGTLVSTA